MGTMYYGASRWPEIEIITKLGSTLRYLKLSTTDWGANEYISEGKCVEFYYNYYALHNKST